MNDLKLEVGMKVFIVKEVRKMKGKDKLVPATKENKFKKKRKNKIRIPAQITSIADLSYSLVQIIICGRIDIEINLKNSYSISIDNLEIPKSPNAWELLAKK